MGDGPTETPAADPGSGEETTDPGTAAPVEGAPPAEGTPGDAPAGDKAAEGDGQAAAPAPKNGKPKPPEKKPEEAPRGPDLTGRLAKLSRENRETRNALKTAQQAATAAAAKVADFDALIAKAQSGDDTAIDAIYARFGLNFERIVNYHAGKPDPTPEQAAAAKLEAIEKRLNDDAAARQREADEAKARDAAAKESSARAEYVGMCGQRIKAQAEKFEICARLGEEAAEAAFGRVVKAWNEAGQPQLMPGELEAAIDTAIEVQELTYEKRRQQLTKGLATQNGTNGHANGAAKKDSDLPAGLTGGKLSDTDEQILNGLIDKTAPGAGSSRAKPRTINSGLGGSAPPKTQPRGSQDPRDALRDVLAGAGITPR